MAGENLATLGLIVDATGAKREIQLTGDELKKLANGGKEAASVMRNLGPAMAPPASVAPAVNRVSEAIKRMQDAARQSGAAKFAEDLRLLEERNNRAVTATQRLSDAMNRMRQSAQQAQAAAMASMIQAADPFQKQAAVAAKATVNFGRLRESLTGVAMAAAGASGPLGSFASTLGMMTAGAPIMVGVLAGIAALAFAWDRLTLKTRAAKKETEEAIARLRDLAKERAQGGYGTTRDDLRAGFGQLLDARAEERRLLATPGYRPGTNRGLDMQLAAAQKRIADLTPGVAAAILEVERIKRESNDRIVKDSEEAADKELAAWKKAMGDRVEAMKETDDLITAQLKAKAAAKARAAEMGELGVGFSTLSVKADAQTRIAGMKIGPEVFAALAAGGARATAALAEMTRAMLIAAKVTAEEAQKRAAQAVYGGIAGDFLARSGPGGSAISAVMSAKEGGPWAMAAAGAYSVATSLVSLSQSARAAAENTMRLKASLEDTILGWEAALGNTGAAKEQKKLRIQQEAEDARKLLDATTSARKGIFILKDDPTYRAALDRINAAEKARLEALGKEAEEIDKVTRSMENMVDGYRYQAAIFKASTPKGPTFPGTPTGILPGGGLLGSGNLTVNVTLPNGEVLASTVIANFQQQAQDQYGDSTRWSEIQ